MNIKGDIKMKYKFATLTMGALAMLAPTTVMATMVNYESYITLVEEVEVVEEVVVEEVVEEAHLSLSSAAFSASSSFCRAVFSRS